MNNLANRFCGRFLKAKDGGGASKTACSECTMPLDRMQIKL